MAQRTKDSKVNYTFLERKRIMDFLKEIRAAGDITIGEMDEKIEELFQMGDQIVDVLLNTIRSCDDEMLAIIGYALEYMDDPELVDPLIEILLDSSVREEVKLRVISILEDYVDTTDPAFAEILGSAFDDFEGMMNRSTMNMLDSIQEDDEALAFLLQNFHEFPPESRIDFVKQFGETKDERAVKILEILAKVDDKDAAKESVKYLGKIKSPRAYAALKGIIEDTDDKDIIQQAEKALQRLRLMEVEPDKNEEEVRTELGDIYKVVISIMDGTGSRMLLIAREMEGKEKHVESINLMLNTTVGIKDCYGFTDMHRREFDQTVREMRREIGAVGVDYEYALALIKDALLLNKESESPIPAEFVLWKRVLSDADITPEKYVPGFELVDVEELRNDVELLEESYELHELEEFANWLEQSPKTYEYYEELDELMQKYSSRALDRKIDNLLKRYAKEVFEPQRDFIKRNLELSADLLFRQPDRELDAQIALAAALNLSSNLPLHEHPFIEQMMENSLEMAEISMLPGLDELFDPEDFE